MNNSLMIEDELNNKINSDKNKRNYEKLYERLYLLLKYSIYIFMWKEKEYKQIKKIFIYYVKRRLYIYYLTSK